MATATEQPGVHVLRKGQGEVVLDPRLAGWGVVTKVPSSATGGSYFVVEHPLMPFALGAPRHSHRNEEETSYVVEGSIMAEIGGRVVTVPAGSLIHKPKGVPHAFWNPNPEPALVLEMIAPGGFEPYFAELARAFQTGGPPDLALMMAVAEKYELAMDLSSVPDLAQRDHLNLGGPPPGQGA